MTRGNDKGGSELFFDGAYELGSQVAAFAWALMLDGQELDSGYGVAGRGPGMSSNVGEYVGLVEGLKDFMGAALTSMKQLNVYGDSMLVVRQMSGHWKVRGGLYVRAHDDALKLVTRIREGGVKVWFEWIPREESWKCDQLSKFAAR
jgi:ribonuclease HI